MKFLQLLIICLLFSYNSFSGDDIFPLRKPESGDNRPSWWWTCWNNYDILVVRGTLSITNEEPVVTLKYNTSLLKKQGVREKYIKLHSEYPHIVLADLKIKEILYVSKIFGKIPENIKVALYRSVTKELTEEEYKINGKSNEKNIYTYWVGDFKINEPDDGIFILEQQVMPPFFWVYSDYIAEDEFKKAKPILEYLKKLDKKHAFQSHKGNTRGHTTAIDKD